MKLKSIKLAPALIAVSIIALVSLVRVLRVDLFDRLERMTYDVRVRFAQRFPSPVATNLGTVFISDNTIRAINQQFGYGIYWPRKIYSRALRELNAQGARAVAFDILFGESHPNDDPVPVGGPNQNEVTDFLRQIEPSDEPTSYTDAQGEKLTLVESDDYFAWGLKRSGIAILAAERSVMPDPLFATNALAIGDISADSDADGVLRRAKAFQDYYLWDRIIVEAPKVSGADLSNAKVEPGRIVLYTHTNTPFHDDSGNQVFIKLNDAGEFDVRQYPTASLSAGTNPWRKPFITHRVWHMGIVLAAQALGLDLEHPTVDLSHGRITLHGNNGFERVIPVDADGYFYINWELGTLDPRLQQEPFEKLLWQDQERLIDHDQGSHQWQNKLVVIGSSATGNDLTDHGATPLAKNALLVSEHWNVANSIITGRFVHRASLGTELALFVIMGLITALLTWRLRTFAALGGVLLLSVAYCAAGTWLFAAHRYWLPLVLPVVGAALGEHFSLVTYRVFFEEREKRRVKSIFSRIVSPDVVNELLQAESLGLGGARREVTTLFADVRGFTELTDVTHERAMEYVRQHRLAGDAAEAHFDEVARETLNTVNTYLALVADMVKKHGGTLDKYIGDCVMAFWGAPTANPRHALACVRAAIEAQRAMSDLNDQRSQENKQRELENKARMSAGLPPKPPLATLSLGTGINTGQVTVGLMGSEAHILNYTIFGREVNLASRLEHESGRGRIVISETTFEHLKRDDSGLAATCVPLEPVTVKGIRTAVKIYEVPWRST